VAQRPGSAFEEQEARRKWGKRLCIRVSGGGSHNGNPGEG